MGLPTALLAISAVASVAGGVSAKKASDKAAVKAQEAANFNAEMIERDVILLQRQEKILNASAILRAKVDRFRFAEMQGSVVNAVAFSGFDIAQGTPMRTLRQNAREFEYDMAVNRFDDSVARMQIADQQEDAFLRAELTRMSGQAQAGLLKSEGRASLISGLGQGARIGSQINFG